MDGNPLGLSSENESSNSHNKEQIEHERKGSNELELKQASL